MATARNGPYLIGDSEKSSLENAKAISKCCHGSAVLTQSFC